MEVFALVGPAGTGKSHRASFVARAHGIDLIIDDGLLIHSGRIVAGSSAKKEDSRFAAVRRAVFHDPDHASEVRAALREVHPDRVLVLGTSLNMVERISDALDLPRPDKVIRISDVASAEEIRHARRVRRFEGKHVIPAPTLEVKKGFSGYLVDPLRFLYRTAKSREVVVEKSIVRPTFNALGKFFISDGVIAAIAERACCEAPGVVAARRAVVDNRPEGVVVVVELTLRYGCSVPDVLRAAQARAREVIEHMTALNALSVDLLLRRIVP
jgi:uncharacterized alkaline shock family protein YloU